LIRRNSPATSKGDFATEKGNRPDSGEFVYSAVEVLVDHDKLLGVGQADRDYHPSASLELVD
jgi:hypothetical protein